MMVSYFEALIASAEGDTRGENKNKYMVTKYWKISLLKERQPVTLFATTTDEMINRDLDENQARSLISIGRQYHRRPESDEQNHRDLAIAAFMAYAIEPGYDREYAHVEMTYSVPQGEPMAMVGSVPIWEERRGRYEQG